MIPTTQGTYAAVRNHIKVGDSFAFVGRSGLFSWLIRTFTGRPTHVAPVSWIVDEAGQMRVVLVEAVEGEGVIPSYASERIAEYDGEVYLMVLDPLLPFQRRNCGSFLKEQIGKTYSMISAVLAAPSQWFRIPGRDRKDALFCSKLDWLSKRAGGISPAFLGNDPSPTPKQLRDLPLWCQFVQVKGEPRKL